MMAHSTLVHPSGNVSVVDLEEATMKQSALKQLLEERDETVHEFSKKLLRVMGASADQIDRLADGLASHLSEEED